MNKRDYFVNAIKAGAYQYKQWIIEAFSITENTQALGKYPYALFKDQEHGYAFINSSTNEPEFIDGVKKDQPLLSFMEPMTAYAGDLPNLHKAVETTYGQFFVNAYVISHAFGNIIPYLNGEITAKQIESEILKRYSDEPKDGVYLPDRIYTNQYLEFAKACVSLEGLSALCVISATQKTITCDPKIAIRRKELLEQYKDQLNDPLIQAKIEEELLAMDRAWMKGDPGERFYIKSKSYNVVRKKMYVMQGRSEQLGADAAYITEPLHDGWDVKNLPAMINTMRFGSYSRGSETQKGGEITKFLYRIFQNSSIAEEDCGSKLGVNIPITEATHKRYIGNSIIINGKPTLLTDDNIKSYIGRTVQMRYPTYCLSKGANFCSTCMGKALENAPNALSSYAATVGSTFMSQALKQMHGVETASIRFSLDDILS